MLNKTTISRLFVGALFIISGLIKANDPLGFSYKLEEYFAPDVLNWTLFQGTEVFLAAFISIGEIVLGAALIAGEKAKLSSWLLLIMMVFFTFLTGYTAIGNWFFENQSHSFTQSMEGLLGFAASDIHYFKDCGCFGDAIPFTPWDSFVKDLVLMVFTLVIFKTRNSIVPNTMAQDKVMYGVALGLIAAFSVLVTNWWFPIGFTILLFGGMLLVKSKVAENAGWIMGAVAFAITTIFPVYTLSYVPVKDFRPYALGENLPNNMVIPEGQEPPLYTVDYTMKSKTTGEEIVVSAIEYLDQKVWENKDLEIVATGDQYLVKEGYEPPIHDFVLESSTTGEDFTQHILGLDYVLLWVAYDLNKSNQAAQQTVAALSREAKEAQIPIYMLTASDFTKAQNFKQQYGIDIETFSCDGTTLKTVIRSNPGLIVLHQGTVIGKYPFRTVPDLEKLRNKLNF
jgi:uncharacterized membrane protein YphA (DoxX/SURF4 family)